MLLNVQLSKKSVEKDQIILCLVNLCFNFWINVLNILHDDFFVCLLCLTISLLPCGVALQEQTIL